jgi:uncharacterized protein (TIGR01777 family)
MKIIITGSSGFLGSELIDFLQRQNHKIKRLVRDQGIVADDIGYWNPAEHILDEDELQEYDAIINLAAENIFGRWTKSKKQHILSTRVKSTQLLTDTLTSMSKPPPILINASAIGFYGDRGDEDLDESSSCGSGFLSEVCRQWEAAAFKASQKDIRVVCLRIGIVLSPKGGALKMMLPSFKFGLGGRIGSGKQYMSWVSIEDIKQIVQFSLVQKDVSGPINAVSPHPVTNQEFTEILAHKLHRPAFIPMPAFLPRWVMGEMADELLLASAKVYPSSLLKAGYKFRFSYLEQALTHLLDSQQT